MTDPTTTDAPSLTSDQLAILRHAIGEPTHADACHPDRVTRNYYFADCTNREGARLVDLGMMSEGGLAYGGRYYRVTPAGFDAVRRTLPTWHAWIVDTSLGSQVVYATTRSRARAHVISSITNAGAYSWRDAVREITSVRRAKP